MSVQVIGNARDHVMARLAAARVFLQSAVESIDDAIALCVDPEEDDDGSERAELLEVAHDSAGSAQRSLELASEWVTKMDPEECEPWDGDADDES